MDESEARKIGTEAGHRTWNCRRHSEYLADAFLLCDKLKNVENAGTLNSPKRREVGADAQALFEYLEDAFKLQERRPYEGYQHDKANLEGQVNAEVTNEYFMRRYAEDLQRQILNQGLLDLIDCQCGCRG